MVPSLHQRRQDATAHTVLARALAIAALLTLLGCVQTAELETVSTPPASATSQSCSAPQFRQLDFWIGIWDVQWAGSPDQPAGHGVNTITREYDNCVIQEHFDGGPSTNGLVGHSVSIYDARLERWRQTWVDNQGGYFALVGGPDGDSFVLENTRLRDSAPHRRMVFEDIAPRSFTWRWQASTDGHTWTDSWVIYYSRRA